MTTPISGLSHLALRVTDLARSRAFYVDALQLPVRFERPGVIMLNVYGTSVALIGNDPHTAKDDHFDPFRVGLDHIALAVPNVQDLNGLLAMLNQAGVRNNGIQDDDGTHATYISFYDPDGIAWELYSLPTGRA